MFRRANRDFQATSQRRYTTLTAPKTWTCNKSPPTSPNSTMTLIVMAAASPSTAICIAQYRPLHGSSYIGTPQWLAKKQAVVNIKNTSDAKCFVWSVLAALHPSAINTNRLYNYRPHENTLNTSGITFPMPIKDIPKFEKQNPSISVMPMWACIACLVISVGGVCGRCWS